MWQYNLKMVTMLHWITLLLCRAPTKRVFISFNLSKVFQESVLDLVWRTTNAFQTDTQSLSQCIQDKQHSMHSDIHLSNLHFYFSMLSNPRWGSMERMARNPLTAWLHVRTKSTSLQRPAQAFQTRRFDQWFLYTSRKAGHHPTGSNLRSYFGSGPASSMGWIRDL